MTEKQKIQKPVWRFIFGIALILQALFEFSNIGTAVAIDVGVLDGATIGATSDQVQYYEDLEILDHAIGVVYTSLLLLAGFSALGWSPRARDLMLGRLGLHFLYFPLHLVWSDYVEALGTPGLVSLGVATAFLLVEVLITLRIPRRGQY